MPDKLYLASQRWVISPVLLYELQFKPIRIEGGLGLGPLAYNPPWSSPPEAQFFNGTYFAALSLATRIIARVAIPVTRYLDLMVRAEIILATPLNSWANFPGSTGSLTAGLQLRLFP